MTHNRMLDRAPSCAILHKGNELKLYQGNQVYLNDGDNFELRFFNPLPEKIGIEILFNSIKKGDAYLVLNPGQDIVLDRFIDEQRKMLFETYVVDGNNEAAVKAIEQNGVITFNFHKEKNSYRNYQNDVKVNYNFPPKPHTSKKCYPTYYGTVPSATCGTTTINVSNTIPFQNDYYFASSNFASSNDSTLSSINSIDYSEYSAENTKNSIDYNDYIKEIFASTIETGRIEKGEISNQTLKGVNLNFESIAFHTITYKIMPISTLNRNIGEIRQYCKKCRYRLRKSSWDFCPSCGERIK